MAKEERYRVWLASDKEWQAGPVFSHLALAIDKARRLAVTRWVAIELPSREWHVFDESKTTRLGPPQFARGSNLDLGDRAAKASDGERETPAAATTDEKPQARTRQYKTVQGGNSTYRVANIRNTGRFATTPKTNTGIGPVAQRSPGSARASGSQSIPGSPSDRMGRLGSSDPTPDAEAPGRSQHNSAQQRPSQRITSQRQAARPSDQPDPRDKRPSTQRPAARQTGPQRARTASSKPPNALGRARRRPSPSTARRENERRANERFAADEVLADPACYVDGQRVEVVDVSETGLQLNIPSWTRLRIGAPLVLAFSDSHGRFDLVVRVIWADRGFAGVQIEEGGTNIVGKMFLRKLIGQLVARRNSQRKRRPSRPRR